MSKILFLPFPVLSTTRLRLDQIELADEKEILALRSDAHNRRYIDGPLAKDSAEAIQFIEKIRKGIAANQWLYWSLRLKESGPLIGSVCLWNFSDDQRIADVGYELAPSHQGQGYMTEILEVIISYGLQTLELEKIVAYTHHQNIKSRELLKRCDFEYVKTVDEAHSVSGEMIKMAVYQIQQTDT